MRTLVRFSIALLHSVLTVFRSREEQAIVELALRQQLATYARSRRRLLREYVDYDNSERVHISIADAPMGRPIEPRPSECSDVVGIPRVGGLHHHYCWRQAA